MSDETPRASPEAERAVIEARDARASCAAVSPLVDLITSEVRAEIEAQPFVDLIERIVETSHDMAARSA